jgi:hypothetical protein
MNVPADQIPVTGNRPEPEAESEHEGEETGEYTGESGDNTPAGSAPKNAETRKYPGDDEYGEEI